MAVRAIPKAGHSGGKGGCFSVNVANAGVM